MPANPTLRSEIEYLLSGESKPRVYFGTDVSDLNGFYTDVIARNGYTQDAKQVVWMHVRGLYNNSHWMNRDLELPFKELVKKRVERMPIKTGYADMGKKSRTVRKRR